MKTNWVALMGAVLLSFRTVCAAAPFAYTQQTIPVDSATVTLAGMATPNGQPSTAWFQWWNFPATATNTTASIDVGGGNNVVRVTNTLTGLTTGSNYRYRLVVSNQNGVVYGAQRSFTTGGTVSGWGYLPNALPPAGLSNVFALVGGRAANFALTADRHVITWGAQLSSQSNAIYSVSNVISMAIGFQTAALLTSSNNVIFFGGVTNVVGFTNIIAIAGEQEFYVALRDDGTVVAGGQNDVGQARVPAGLSNVVAVAAANGTSAALKNDGTIVLWGSDANPITVSNVVAMAGGAGHLLAMRQDGSVVSWWDWYPGTFNVVAGVSNAIDLATSAFNGSVLREDGTIFPIVWLPTVPFVPTNVPPGLNNVAAIADGGETSFALGPNIPPMISSTNVAGPANTPLVVQLGAIDPNNDVATINIESVPQWGVLYQYTPAGPGYVFEPPETVSDPSNRVIYVPSPNYTGSDSFTFTATDGTHVSSLATVNTQTFGNPYLFTRAATKIHPTDATLNGTISANGLVTGAFFQWGTNNVKENSTDPVIGTNVNVVQISALLTNLIPGAVYHYRLIATNSCCVNVGAERIFTTGRNVTQFNSATPRGLTNIVAIGGGWHHSLAVRNDGSVVGWGDNTYGQITIPPITNAVAVAGGAEHSVAILDDGSTIGWGTNSSGQLPAWTNIIDIAAGQYHTVGLRADGTVVAVGSSVYGQATIPEGLSNVVQVAAGDLHTVALRNDGTVVAWGSNNGGPISVPAGLSNVVAISAGSQHTLALKSDGTVVGWGAVSAPYVQQVTAIASCGGVDVFMTQQGHLQTTGIYFPGSLTNAVAVAANYNDAFAIANLPPTANGVTRTGPANNDLLITLSATDVNYDPLTFRVTQFPTNGTLYQFANGARGAVINPGDQIADPQARLFYAPATDTVGTDTFYYVANDGTADSRPGPVIMIISGTARAVTQNATSISSTNVTLNGAAFTSGLTSTAWFQWGTNSNFGNTTASMNIGSGLNAAPLSMPIDSLTAGVQYRCRLVVSNAVGISYGNEVAFTTGSQIWAWGLDNSGQTDVPPGITNAVALAGGAEHSLALLTDGTVVGWGRNDAGQATPPPGMSNVVAIACGAAHSLALLNDGTVTAWGTNNFGQTNVPPLNNVRAIAAGANHNLALLNDGTVVAWGANNGGQLNMPGGLSNVVAIAAGATHSVALKMDGTLVAWGTALDPAAGGTNIVAPATATNVVAIAANAGHNLALRADGSVLSWGNGSTLYPPGNATNVISVCLGTNHYAALRRDNSAVLWGINQFGQGTLPANIAGVTSLACGDNHTLALITGRVPVVFTLPANLAVSTNGSGVDPSAVALNGAIAPNGFDALAWFEWGTTTTLDQTTSPVQIFGSNSLAHVSTPVAPGDFTPVHFRIVLSNATGVYRGIQQAFSAKGRIVAWGNTSYGQTNPPGDATYATVAAGTYSAIASRNDGTVATWGTDIAGLTLTPPSATNIINVALGLQHGLLLRADGTVYAWGSNTSGQTNVPANVSNIVAIAAGDNHSVALDADGNVYAWGSQTNAPAWLSNVVAIAASGSYSLALRNDGTVVGWGTNSFGQFNVPGMFAYCAIAAAPNYAGALQQNGMISLSGHPPGYPYFAVPSATNVIALAAGQNLGIALQQNETITNWTFASLVPPAIKATAIAAGPSYALAITPALASPYANTLPPYVLSDSTVLLRGAVGANDGSATAWFEWGLPSNLTVTNGPLLATNYYFNVVSNIITGLTPGTIYSYRLVVSNRTGITFGTEQHFTTGMRMIAWGSDTYRQLEIPPGQTNMIACSVGLAHSVALHADGSMVAWGTNALGPLLPPPDASNFVAIFAAKDHNLALRNDGTLVAWGESTYNMNVIPSADTNILAIACGPQHNTVVRVDGTVDAWGSISGQFPMPPGISNCVAVAGGTLHNIALRLDGTVLVWGSNAYGQSAVPATATNVVAIAAGFYHSLALRANGTVVAWGYNGYGQTNVPSNLTNVIAIAASGYASCALKKDGTLVFWGDSTVRQGLTTATNIASVSIGSVSSLALGPNLAPVAHFAYVVGYPNVDLTVPLNGTDANGDLLAYRVTSLPTNGALFQYQSGARGPQIVTVPAALTDSSNRLIYAPAPDAIGTVSFSYVVNDGVYDSTAGPVTIQINLPSAPQFRLPQPGAFNNNRFQILFSGSWTANYRVWSSTNLQDWLPLGSATLNSNNLFEFWDTNAIEPQKFYRATAP